MEDVFRVAGDTWFLWSPIVSILLFFEAWVTYVRNDYKSKLKWTFLEIRIPREIRRGPKAMEQVFSSLHSFIGGPSAWYDYYWTGELKTWYSFEIASFGGDIHFFLRTPKKHKNYVEANLYAQYPDLEITEADDYILRMPPTFEQLEQAGYDVWGTELLLEKDDVYPIRTYEEFETPSEYSTLDPVSSLIEVLGTVRSGEEVWLQVLASPASSGWQKKGAAFIKKLQEKTRIKTESADGKKITVDRTPGEELALKSIERNISKPGFQTTIRYVYLAPTELYDKNLPWYGMLGSFNQYSSKTLNSFRHDVVIRTAVLWFYWPFFFPAWRSRYRKRNIYRMFRNRFMKESSFFILLFTRETLSLSHIVLNTEELATIYHYPSNFVLTAPAIQRVESKKVGPPARLPVAGEKENPLQGLAHM